jgi:hypothetical protein
MKSLKEYKDYRHNKQLDRYRQMDAADRFHWLNFTKTRTKTFHKNWRAVWKAHHIRWSKHMREKYGKYEKPKRV